ncbi:transglutaminase [Actinoplanes sp. ATCC 53533]|uniref:transglutaminaseTgpA domain-containing protein n=1 Tax=Actinoplanes sp. ATCC 53533 TaxID=1288362 RepID=UPI000F78CF8E|nr:transglutaminaseTgpA domain-containing protein [Actinoplanes sp. ATCC 53533]RSM56840.1 transglutaminase [Actinoplanes sp. ATCC 53533]
MIGRRRLGLVAAAAALLAAAPLDLIFDTYTWLVQSLIVVALVAGTAVLTRTVRFPTWAQSLGMIVALMLVLTWMYPSGKELLSLVPGPSTFTHFGELFAQAGDDARSYGVPVPDREGLLFAAVLGIGAVAIAVDLLTVVARRPALAGLPMLAIYSVPVAVSVDSVPVLPFVVGATGFLWLLVADNVDRVRRFGRRFTGDGRGVDVWEPSPLAAAGRRLAVIGVAAAVLLPLIIPGLNTGGLNQLTQAGSGGNGSGGGTGRINLFAALSGQLNQTTTTAYVKVKTNEPDPFYLRFGVADVLTDQGFSSRAPSGRPLSRGLDNPSQSDGVDYRQYRAEVEITEDFGQKLAPIYSNIVGVNGLDAAWSYDPDTQVVFSNRTTTKGKKYSFDYLRAKYTPAQLRTAQPLARTEPLRAQFTTVPDDPKIKTLVRGLVENERTDYDRVSAIYRYFSRDNGFTYSLRTADPQVGASAIAAFLEGKAGYCQQYAAAMAWMVREAGIPARVAFGFTRGSTRDGDAYVLTNRNAHAWTEVYLDGFGWVPFDATPAAAVAGSSRSDWAPDTDRAEAPDATASPGTAPDAAASTGPSTASRPDRDLDNGALGSQAAATPGTTSSTGLFVAGIAALIALLAVPALRRALVRRRRYAATVPKAAAVDSADDARPQGRDVVVMTEQVQAREDAHAAWDELVDTMIDYRVPVDPTETPRHTAQRLIREANLQEAPAESAHLLGRAEERARYARQPLQGGELTIALGRVRKGLAQTATKRTRLTAVLLPPSVLMRWRMGIGDVSARWMDAFSHARDLAARFSPRRLLPRRAR